MGAASLELQQQVGLETHHLGLGANLELRIKKAIAILMALAAEEKTGTWVILSWFT